MTFPIKQPVVVRREYKSELYRNGCEGIWYRLGVRRMARGTRFVNGKPRYIIDGELPAAWWRSEKNMKNLNKLQPYIVEETRHD